MNRVFDKTIDYIKLRLGDKFSQKGTLFTCPKCLNEPPSANIIPNTSTVFCLGKCKTLGNIFSLVRIMEPERAEHDEDTIADYLKTLLNINILTKAEVNRTLEFFVKNDFDIVPIAKNQKIPIEKDWPNKEHKNPEDWKRWIFEDDINIGVKSGKRSGVTVIDIDQKEIPAEIKDLLIPTLIQTTNKGYHYIYKYEPELPTTRIDELKIDILNDGKQFVVFPSVVDNEKRVLELCDIQKMPEALKNYLKKRVCLPTRTMSERLQEEIATGNFDMKLIDEGNRNNFLIHLGGLCRKEMNLQNTTYVLNLINRHFCKPTLSSREFTNIVKTLDRYVAFDEQELSVKILNYMRVVEEANSRDVKEAIGESKERIDKTLAYLVKEGYLIKSKRTYYIIKRADWKDTFPSIDCALPFKMPYFYDVCHFQWGDMLLLGSKAKFGKTTISINLVKSFVQQGYKPYYISLETGSRFTKTAVQLGLKEGDFCWDFQADPTKIELEQNAITIVDWLLVEDKAQTDSVMKHFVEQLYKTKGFLIVFMQLKENGDWFAPNMVKQFPTLAARYLYENEQDGTYGKWLVDVIREPLDRRKGGILQCQYLWDERRLVRLDELEKESQ